MRLAPMRRVGQIPTVVLMGPRTNGTHVTMPKQATRQARPAGRWMGLAVTVVLTSCSGATAADKAGGSPEPLVLRIGTDDFAGRPASDQIEEFARRVEERSDGEILVQAVWHAAGDGPDWDQRVARMVVSGALDLGNIPARSWDTEGVTTLRALNAPFLVTSDDLVAEIVDGDLAGKLMSGLESAGVVGLSLLPEGLRHPFGVEHALTGPDDFQGATIRMPTSATTIAVMEALGATTNDAELDRAVHDGMESGFVLVPGAGHVTANLTFFPKVNSLVVNAEVFDRLTDEQREILRVAADDTRKWAIANTTPDHELAEQWCAGGGGVALSTEAELGALRQAAAPVYSMLESDEPTRDLIAEIRKLADAHPPSPAPPVCAIEVVEPLPAGTANELNGIYRFEITDEELAATGTAARDVNENHGTYTFTIEGDELCFEQQAPNRLYTPSDCGRVVVEGDELIVGILGMSARYRWELLDDDSLQLTFVDASPSDAIAPTKAWAFEPWVRIGDAESDGTPVDGVYRFEVTLEDMEAGGVGRGEALQNYGIWTITLHEGLGEWFIVAPTAQDDTYEYIDYALDGDRMIVTYDGGESEVFRWEVLDSGDLALDWLDGPPGYRALSEVIVAEPWTRIGEASPIEVKDAPD